MFGLALVLAKCCGVLRSACRRVGVSACRRVGVSAVGVGVAIKPKPRWAEFAERGSGVVCGCFWLFLGSVGFWVLLARGLSSPKGWCGVRFFFCCFFVLLVLAFDVLLFPPLIGAFGAICTPTVCLSDAATGRHHRALD